jgi:mono/diheme cytochrome c family protein
METGRVFRSVVVGGGAYLVAMWSLSQLLLGYQQAAGTQGNATAGIYSAEQAGRGQSLYIAQCAQCHGESLAGTEFGPPLIGNTFVNDFGGGTAGDLFDRIQTTMPQSNPGVLSGAEAVDVIAYLLRNNDFPAGREVLRADPAVLKTIKIDAKK